MDGMPGWIEAVRLGEGGASVDEIVEEVQRRLTAEAWERSEFNQTETARILGIKRTTLRKRLVRFGLLVA